MYCNVTQVGYNFKKTKWSNLISSWSLSDENGNNRKPWPTQDNIVDASIIESFPNITGITN